MAAPLRRRKVAARKGFLSMRVALYAQATAWVRAITTRLIIQYAFCIELQAEIQISGLLIMRHSVNHREQFFGFVSEFFQGDLFICQR
jgi:hypothetical protein